MGAALEQTKEYLSDDATWQEPGVWNVPGLLGYQETDRQKQIRHEIVSGYPSNKGSIQEKLAEYDQYIDSGSIDVSEGRAVMLGLIAWKTDRNGNMEKSIDAADRLGATLGLGDKLGNRLMKLYGL